MPSKSAKQHNLMAAVANSPEFSKKTGIPSSVGEKYMEADKAKKGKKSADDWKEMGFPSKAAYQKYKESEVDRKMKKGAEDYKKQRGKKKSIMDDAAGNSYAKGGKVRGAGCAKRGVKKAKMR